MHALFGELRSALRVHDPVRLRAVLKRAREVDPVRYDDEWLPYLGREELPLFERAWRDAGLVDLLPAERTVGLRAVHRAMAWFHDPVTVRAIVQTGQGGRFHGAAERLFYARLAIFSERSGWSTPTASPFEYLEEVRRQAAERSSNRRGDTFKSRAERMMVFGVYGDRYIEQFCQRAGYG